MDERFSPLMDGGDFGGLLEDIDGRLEKRAQAPAPRGLTEADADSGERWEALQV